MRLFREGIRMISTTDKERIPEVHQCLRNREKKGNHEPVKKRNRQLTGETEENTIIDAKGVEISKRKQLSTVSKALEISS